MGCVLFQSNSSTWNSIRKVSLKTPRAAGTGRENLDFLGENPDFLGENLDFLGANLDFLAKILFYPLETHRPIPRHFVAGSWSKESRVFAFWKMNLDAVIYLLPLIV